MRACLRPLPTLQGMVTRKDLLGFKLDEAVKRARTGRASPALGSGALLESPHALGSPRLPGLSPTDATPDRY